MLAGGREEGKERGREKSEKGWRVIGRGESRMVRKGDILLCRCEGGDASERKREREREGKEGRVLKEKHEG